MAQPAAQDRQIFLLQYQIQQCLNQLRPERFEVRVGASLIDDGGPEFQPALSVFERIKPDCEPAVLWVIDIADSGVLDEQPIVKQRHLCARLASSRLLAAAARSICAQNLFRPWWSLLSATPAMARRRTSQANLYS